MSSYLYVDGVGPEFLHALQQLVNSHIAELQQRPSFSEKDAGYSKDSESHLASTVRAACESPKNELEQRQAPRQSSQSWNSSKFPLPVPQSQPTDSDQPHTSQGGLTQRSRGAFSALTQESLEHPTSQPLLPERELRISGVMETISVAEELPTRVESVAQQMETATSIANAITADLRVPEPVQMSMDEQATSANSYDNLRPASHQTQRSRGAFSARALAQGKQELADPSAWQPLPETTSRSIKAKDASMETFSDTTGRTENTVRGFAQSVFGEALGLLDSAELGITDTKIDGPNRAYIKGVEYEALGNIIVRQEEAMESATVGQYASGTKVTVLEIGTGATGRRVKIRTATGAVGWISVVSNDGKQLLKRAEDGVLELLSQLGSN